VPSDQAREFIAHGWVAIEDALDPAFCEDVVVRGFERLGVDATDPRTWPAGWRNLPVERAFAIDEIAPRASAVRNELVGGPSAIRFGDIPDNLIFNFHDDAPAWEPSDWSAAGADYHKDGDFFRHFLDSPEQGLLGIVFWRDVAADQGATFAVADSIRPIATRLAAHPGGMAIRDVVVPEVLEQCQDFRPLTGRQGTIVWAHPFLIHSKSVNVTDRPRVISNTSVMLRAPLQFQRDDGRFTPVEQVILDALGVSSLSFAAEGPRERVASERERRWQEQAASQ
jgi:hypothetical protein